MLLNSCQKRGWHACPSKSIPAGEIEKFVVDQVRGIGRDPALLVETLSGARAEAKARIEELEAEKSGLERDLKRHNSQMRELAGEIGSGNATTERMADLLDRVRGAEERLAQVRDELARLGRDLIDEDEAIRALAAFDPVWETLTLREQARVLQLLIQRVDLDGDKGTVSVTFHPAGIETLSREYAVRIPLNSATDSDRIRPPSPTQIGHPFRGIPATCRSAATQGFLSSRFG